MSAATSTLTRSMDPAPDDSIHSSGCDPVQGELFLLAHLPQVHMIARRIHNRLPPQVLIEDLVHAGILGLMDAIRKYDPARNVQLKHYAEFRIRGAILDSLRDVDWSPRRLRQQGRRLQNSIADCKARLGREPSESEIAGQLQMALPDLQHLRTELRRLEVASLQELTAESDRREEVCASRAAPEEEDPFRCTLRSEMADLLAKAIEDMPLREREVLALYHYEELTMKEVGEVLGIGESRVSQIHSVAMPRLRERLQLLLAGSSPVQGISRPAA